MSEKSNNSNTITFILGAIIGATIVYLTATDNGKKVATKIKKTAENIFANLENDLTDEVEFSHDQEPQSVINDNEEPDRGVDYIKDIQNRGRTVSRRFFKRH